MSTDTFDATDFKDIVSANKVLSRKEVWTHGISAIQHLSDAKEIGVSRFLVRLDGVDEESNAHRTQRIAADNHPTVDENGVVFNNILFVGHDADPQILLLKYTT